MNDVQINDTIFILSTQLIYGAKFHAKTTDKKLIPL
jgi:hypothetical protein